MLVLVSSMQHSVMAVQDRSLQAGLEISVCPHAVRFLSSLLPLVRALLSLFAPCTYKGKHTYLVMIIFSLTGVLDNGHVRKRVTGVNLQTCNSDFENRVHNSRQCCRDLTVFSIFLQQVVKRKAHLVHNLQYHLLYSPNTLTLFRI